MMSMLLRLERSADDLWFRRRPALAMIVAGVLFAGVFLLRVSEGGPTEAYSMLYVLPVSLLAVAFGVRGGAAGGLVAVALMAIWALVVDVDLSPLAWLSRVIPMLALGLLLGYATDRARRAEARQREVEAAALLHQQAIELNDSLVQGLAAARWALDQGRVDDGVALLDQTMSEAQGMVSDLIRRARMGGVAAPVTATRRSR
jgi:hypothetical protein